VKIHPIPLEGSNLHCYQTTIASGQEEFLNGLAVLRLSRTRAINAVQSRIGGEKPQSLEPALQSQVLFHRPRCFVQGGAG
jgi:hypothetical protein